jgi:type I restriction enzyme, S subunit
MSTYWDLKPLAEVLTQYKEYIEAPEPKIYPKLSVKLYGKGVVLDEPANGTFLKMKQHQIAKSGQVILSEIWGKKGAIGFVPPEGEGALCTSHFFLFDVNHNKLEPKYLQLLFTANYLEGQLNTEAKGTTGYAAVRPRNLLAAKIPLPPLEEQGRIVARIEEMVGKIEGVRSLRQKALEEAEALRVSSAKSIFHDLAQVSTQPLRELVTVQGGGTPSKQNPFFWDGSIPWISPKDMKSREIYNSIDHISEEATRKSSAKLLKPGSILIVVRGMILAHTVPSAILRISAAINQDMKALFPNEKITPEFLSCVFWTLNDSLLELVEKSTHDTRKLETPKLLNFKIPVPPLPEQHRIVTYLDELQSKVDTMKRLRQEAIKELDALLPSILDKAFKGEL